MEYQFPLKNRRLVAEQTMEFCLDISGQEFLFKAGQHADFSLENPPHTDEKGNQRIFSYVSSPNDHQNLCFATRLTGSAFKQSLSEVPLGTLVTVRDSRGQMTLHQDPAKSAVFLAGGIGITPFMSMIRYATEQQLPHRIYLFYANRTPESTAFLDDLHELAKQNSNLTIIHIFSETTDTELPHETGHLTAEILHTHVKSLDSSYFSMAGPPAMVASLSTVLDELGIADEYRKSEDFSGYGEAGN